MKSVLYHDYEPNSDFLDSSDDLKVFLDTIKYSIGNRILLIGDIGNLGKKLRRLGVHVTILEDSSNQDVCYSLINNENCNVIKGSLEYLPFNDAYFDKVIILDYLNHAINCTKALDEINRVLKHNGDVVVEDLNLKNVKVKLKNLKHKILGEHVQYFYPQQILKIFSDLEFEGSLKELENERYIYIGKRK